MFSHKKEWRTHCLNERKKPTLHLQIRFMALWTLGHFNFKYQDQFDTTAVDRPTHLRKRLARWLGSQRKHNRGLGNMLSVAMQSARDLGILQKASVQPEKVFSSNSRKNKVISYIFLGQSKNIHFWGHFRMKSDRNQQRNAIALGNTGVLRCYSFVIQMQQPWFVNLF